MAEHRAEEIGEDRALLSRNDDVDDHAGRELAGDVLRDRGPVDADLGGEIALA